MTRKRDDWEKTRGHGQHFTLDEIAQIRRAFFAGRSSREAAQEMKCSSRVASKYYGFFKAEGHVMGAPVMAPPPKLPMKIEGSFITPPSKARLMAGK